MRIAKTIFALLVFAAATPLSAAVETNTETQYYALFATDKKVGHAVETRTISAGRVTTSVKTVISMARNNVPVTIRSSETAIETTAGKPLGFKSVMELGAMAMTTEGTINDQGKIDVVISVGQNRRTQTIPWPEGALMAEGMRLLELKKGLKEGTQYTAKILTPSLLKAWDTKVVIGPKVNCDLLGRVVRLTEGKVTTAGPTGSIESTVYVNDRMQMQKAIMLLAGMRVEMVACNRAFALSKSDVVDFLKSAGVSGPVAVGRVVAAEAITYHIEPIGKAKLSFLADGNQTVRRASDGTFLVTVRPAKAPGGAVFPYKGKAAHCLSALKPNRFVNSDDQKVIALARNAVGDTNDAAAAVRRIEAFVYKHVEKKDLSVGFATAGEVAVSRQGDCTEHAVLATAMCRAVGIPAQMVSGLVHVEREIYGKPHAFWPHAWTRAYVGGKWIHLDATGKRYHPGHIAFAAGSGEPAYFFNLVNTVGNFRITKLEVDQ